ncbi:MAG: caspase family protein, partial [Candidatus Kryptoniota bacterium]
ALPPQLVAQLSFKEPSGNNLLDADERGEITIRVTNTGKGMAYQVGSTVIPGSYDGLNYRPQFNIGDIMPGESKAYTFYVEATHSVKSMEVPLEFRFNELNGFEPPPVKIVFSTKAFVPPKLIVADVGVKDADGSTIIRPGRVVEITVRIQNTGKGEAKDVTAAIKLGENVFIAEGSNTSFSLGNLSAGEYRDIKFSIYTNNRATEVPVYVDLNEHFGLYGISNIKLPLEFNKVMAQLNEIIIKPKDEEKTPIIGVSKGLSIDVDREIPHSSIENKNAVALILAISDYQNEDIPKVQYAKHDAEVVREYLIKALGYSPENILPKNPDELMTYGQIKTYIQKVLPSYLKPDGSSDLFVYYTGHGAPSTTNHEAYLVPWDCNPNYVSDDNAYETKQFYLDIEKLNARQKIIIVDACFSGQTGSGKTLIKYASPALLRVNNPLIADSSTVIFQSSRAEQVSNWYEEKRHGMFTYFFLKGLQGNADYDGNGKITAGELIRYINNRNEGLPYYSNRLYQRPQEAQLEGNVNMVIERIEK